MVEKLNKGRILPPLPVSDVRKYFKKPMTQVQRNDKRKLTNSYHSFGLRQKYKIPVDSDLLLEHTTITMSRSEIFEYFVHEEIEIIMVNYAKLVSHDRFSIPKKVVMSCGSWNIIEKTIDK